MILFTTAAVGVANVVIVSFLEQKKVSTAHVYTLAQLALLASFYLIAAVAGRL